MPYHIHGAEFTAQNWIHRTEFTEFTELNLLHRAEFTAQNCTDKTLRPHVKLHIDYHILADRGVFMQDGTAPHTARMSQEFITIAIIDVIRWPAKIHLSIALGTYGRFY